MATKDYVFVHTTSFFGHLDINIQAKSSPGLWLGQKGTPEISKKKKRCNNSFIPAVHHHFHLLQMLSRSVGSRGMSSRSMCSLPQNQQRCHISRAPSRTTITPFLCSSPHNFQPHSLQQRHLSFNSLISSLRHNRHRATSIANTSHYRGIITDTYPSTPLNKFNRKLIDLTRNPTNFLPIFDKCREIKESHLKPDLTTYHALLEAHERNNDLTSISRTLEEMELVGVQPTISAFNIGLRVCSSNNPGLDRTNQRQHELTICIPICYDLGRSFKRRHSHVGRDPGHD